MTASPEAGSPLANRSKARAAALLAAVFLAGAAGGWAARSWRPERGPRERFRGTDAMVAYLDRELDLTGAQRDSVRAVFLRHRGEMDSIWSVVHPRLDSLRHTMRAEVAAQLDSTRRAEYLRLLAAHEHRHRRRGGGGGGGDSMGRRN